MDCPKCGLTNPTSASRCDCGYDFDLQRDLRPESPDALLAKQDIRTIGRILLSLACLPAVYWVLGIVGVILGSWDFDLLSVAFFSALTGLAFAGAILSRSRTLCLIVSLVLVLSFAKALLEMNPPPFFKPELVFQAVSSLLIAVLALIATVKSFRYHRLKSGG